MTKKRVPRRGMLLCRRRTPGENSQQQKWKQLSSAFVLVLDCRVLMLGFGSSGSTLVGKNGPLLHHLRVLRKMGNWHSVGRWRISDLTLFKISIVVLIRSIFRGLARMGKMPGWRAERFEIHPDGEFGLERLHFVRLTIVSLAGAIWMSPRPDAPKQRWTQ